MFCKCSLYSTAHCWVIFDSCEQLSIQCITLLRTYLRIVLVATLPVTVSLCSWEIIRLSPLRFLRSDGHVSNYLLILLQPCGRFIMAWTNLVRFSIFHSLKFFRKLARSFRTLILFLRPVLNVPTLLSKIWWLNNVKAFSIYACPTFFVGLMFENLWNVRPTKNVEQTWMLNAPIMSDQQMLSKKVGTFNPAWYFSTRAKPSRARLFQGLTSSWHSLTVQSIFV